MEVTWCLWSLSVRKLQLRLSGWRGRLRHFQPGWPDWAKFRHLGNFLWHWANFFLEKIAQWFGHNFSHEKNHPKLTLIKLKFCSKRGFFTCFSKIFKKFYLLFYVKKTIRECPVPLDINIKSNRKHHKTVLYSKSNKNMVERLLGRFFHKNIWSPYFRLPRQYLSSWQKRPISCSIKFSAFQVMLENICTKFFNVFFGLCGFWIWTVSIDLDRSRT